MPRALLLALLLAGCATPVQRAAHPLPRPPIVRPAQRNADVTREYRRADDRAFNYVAEPGADPAVIATIRALETAVDIAGQGAPRRAAVEALVSYLTARGIPANHHGDLR